jgi:hypothetical protein
MLDPTCPQTHQSEARRAARRARQRAYRARRRDGRIVIELEVDHFETAELLVREGLLGQWDAEDRSKVRAAFERALREGTLRITGPPDRDV